MLLDLAVGTVLCLAPLLQGSWDLWSQTLVRLAALSLGTGWLCWRIFTGSVPAPGRRTLFWAAVLAACTLAAAAFSPLHALAWPDAANGLLALALVCAAPMLTRGGREAVETALRLTVWILWALAFYQRFFLHELPPASALINPNVFAGYLLMAMALAWRWHDWPLVIACLWALVWSHSLGAWMSLSAAMVLLGWRRSPQFFWTGVAVAAFAAIALYGKLQDPESAHRLVWWGAALRMAADRPWLGWGPGTFAYLLPAYRHDALGGLGSLYAHQAWLELAVGYGLPAALLVLAAVASVLWSARGVVRLGLLAACLHSLGDYALLIPANLWLFAYLLGTTLPPESGFIGVPSRRKPLAILLVLALSLPFAWAMASVWQADRLTAQARDAASAADMDSARGLLEEARGLAPLWPASTIMLAQVESRGDRARATGLQERATELNPYRPASWRDLARLRTEQGDRAGADAAIVKGRTYIPWLK